MSSDPRPPTPPGTPILGHAVAFAADPFGFTRRAVESTGDVFRMQLLGRDVYVVADPDLVATALQNRERFAKLNDFEVAFGDALLAVEGEQWRRQRHAMADFFDPTRIQEYADTMVDVAESRVDNWAAGDVLDVGEEMRSIALRNLFEVVFGRSISDADLEALADSAHALNGWFEPTSWIFPRWVPTPARRRFRRGSRDLREWARSLLEDGADGGPQAESLLARLDALRADPESEFDRSEVIDQVVGMIFAGHETTALAMTYGLHQLESHPDVARNVRAELEAVLDDQPSLAELQELTYLDDVISETLRLYPPVHAIPRTTTDRVELGEYVLPAGEQVLLSVWSIHRDPRFYDDPGEFDPSRWEHTTPRKRGPEYIPFGSGPRICIGRHFSRLEMTATLATVGRRYRLEELSELAVRPQMTTQPVAPVTGRLQTVD
jgi:cytochrome P450